MVDMLTSTELSNFLMDFVLAQADQTPLARSDEQLLWVLATGIEAVRRSHPRVAHRRYSVDTRRRRHIFPTRHGRFRRPEYGRQQEHVLVRG